MINYSIKSFYSGYSGKYLHYLIKVRLPEVMRVLAWFSFDEIITTKNKYSLPLEAQARHLLCIYLIDFAFKNCIIHKTLMPIMTERTGKRLRVLLWNLASSMGVELIHCETGET